MAVLLETTAGDIVIDLFTKERPKCSLNFLKLCKLKYYNYCLFHSIEENYIAQSGDPTGTGKGGESVSGIVYGEQARYIEAETVPKIRHKERGLVSMVCSGDGLFGSQFFITLESDLDYLDNQHCVFGRVSDGLDTALSTLNSTICDEDHRPYQDVRVLHTIILDDPFDDPKGLQVSSRSPSPDMELLKKTSRIGIDETLDEFEGKPEGEVQEYMEAKEATTRATILEMIGDLHEADELPPDNVLFVCKLNAVTTDEDLEIIFSRFGPIKKCEVIKDRKTGNSLQYAFIEFEEKDMDPSGDGRGGGRGGKKGVFNRGVRSGGRVRRNDPSSPVRKHARISPSPPTKNRGREDSHRLHHSSHSSADSHRRSSKDWKRRDHRDSGREQHPHQDKRQESQHRHRNNDESDQRRRQRSNSRDRHSRRR